WVEPSAAEMEGWVVAIARGEASSDSCSTRHGCSRRSSWSSLSRTSGSRRTAGELIPRRRRASASLLTALALIVCGCSASVPSLPTPGVGPVSGGQVAEAVVGTFVTLNPLFEQEVNGTEIDSLVYQGLTTVAGNQQVVG